MTFVSLQLEDKVWVGKRPRHTKDLSARISTKAVQNQHVTSYGAEKLNRYLLTNVIALSSRQPMSW